MYEGKPPQNPQGQDSIAESDLESGLAGSLQQITWNGLRARLEAARDLRASLAQFPEGELASFDAHSARRIAEQEEGKHTVNPDDLGNGKGIGPIGGGTENNGIARHRGNT